MFSPRTLASHGGEAFIGAYHDGARAHRWRTGPKASTSMYLAREQGNDRDADIDRDGQHIEVRIRAAACLDAHRIKHGVLRDAEV